MKKQNIISNHQEKLSFTRLILQIFVWMLIIAFVSTLGVMWDGTSSAFPIVISSSKGNVDLSPRSLYFMEYNKINSEISTNNQNIDPRILERYIRQQALTNTINLFTRQLFYDSINLKPSKKSYQNIATGSDLNSNLVEFQYAESVFTGPLGVLPILSTPTISDMYTVTDLQKLTLAIDLIVLNKTNFLYSQVDKEKINAYYKENFDQWLDKLTFHEFSAKNRKEARQLITLLKNEGFESVISKENKNITFTSDVVLTANSSNFTYFNNVLASYKSNLTDTLTITAPIYNKGKYNVIVVEEFPAMSTLPTTIQREIAMKYISHNFKQLSQEYGEAWKKQINNLQQNVTNDSFSSLVNDVQGSVNYSTQEFNLTQRTITNVLGYEISLPILNNRELLQSILNTPLSESSPMLTTSEDVYLAIRPIFKKYDTSKTNNFNDPRILQNIYQYKAILLNNSLNSEQLKQRFNIKVNVNQLTNLN